MMNFSYGKLVTLRPQKEKKLSTFLIALAVAAAFFVPYIILGKGYFIFYGDFNVQQIPFYKMCHKAIRSGNIYWNWTTDLGANFIGSYGFYLLGSPFFWVTLLFPNSFVPYLMGPLLILKFAFAALTGYVYIRRFTKTAVAAQLGGLLYAFSGFSVYNIFFNHFHEAIICFPLLLLALELLITENRRGPFALAVCLCALVNYFFFFGMVVFTVIYYFVRIFSKAIKFRFSTLLVIITEAVLGVGMAAILLIPSYKAIIGNSRVSSLLLGWSGITYGKEQIYLNIIECFFFPPDLPARPVFFPGANVKWSSLGGWLPIFSMTGVFGWFSAKKGNWLKRIIAICIFMALIPILNSAFYAFNTAYYARWFYMPVLMMCLATVMLTEDYSADWKSGFKWTLGITVAFALVIGLFPQKNDKNKLVFGLYSYAGKDITYTARFWLTCFIAIMSLVILYVLIGSLKTNRKRFYTASIVCVCIATVVYANIFVAMGRSHSYEIKDVMIDKLIEGKVSLKNTDEYRVDVYDGVDNTSMYLGLNGINAFHSIVPYGITDYYNYIGVSRTVGSRPNTDLPAIRPLLSVKYLLNRNDGKEFVDDDGEALMSGYKYSKTSGGYYIYENENYIPYGFSYDYYMSHDFCDSYSDDAKTRYMLKAMLLDDDAIKTYKDYFAGNIANLKNSASVSDAISLSLSDSAMENDCNALAKTGAVKFETDNYGFSAKVEREEKSLVFFSVPFDEGWTATVNGKETEIIKANVGFMAVAVPKGTSSIRFNYETPGLSLGIQITVLSLVLFLFYFLFASIFVRRHPADIFYPEGEELLKQWHKDDIAQAASDLNYYDIEDDFEPTLLDKMETDDIDIPHIDSGFDGGFKIDPSAFDDQE